MIYERQPGGRRIQANRHLREWNTNLALETTTRYGLDNKHQQERSYFSVEGTSSEQQAELRIQQSLEVDELKRQHRETRIALQNRHLQEKADLDRDLAL